MLSYVKKFKKVGLRMNLMEYLETKRNEWKGKTLLACDGLKVEIKINEKKRSLMPQLKNPV